MQKASTAESAKKGPERLTQLKKREALESEAQP